MRPLILMTLLTATLSGCTGPTASDPSNVRPGAAYGTDGATVDYGNGVWYFDAVRANFGNKLAAFVAVHPELELVTMTGDATGTNGFDLGYFVIFRKKAPCGQAEAPAK